METKNTEEKYTETIKARVEAAQKSGDIPELFTYVHNNKKWVMTLPHSVMQQKRLVYARNAFMLNNSFEAEEALLKLIAANTTVDGRPVTIDQLTMGELEVMKLAYLDGLILPLSLGGDRDVMTYMDNVIAQK